LAINGKSVTYLRELEPFMSEAYLAKNDESIKVEVDRAKDLNATPEKSEVLLKKIEPKNVDNLLAEIGVEKPNLYIAHVVDKSPAEKAGIKSGDRLLTINDLAVADWDEVIAKVSGYAKNDPPLKVQVVRDGQNVPFEIAPEKTSLMTIQGQQRDRFTIGISPYVVPAQPIVFEKKVKNPLTALLRGIDRSWTITVMTGVSIVRLIQNKISPKNLGGVIAIGQAASRTFSVGLAHFFQMMALISINLFILNLLPIPILDGGHLVFYMLEAFKGGPISLRKMEIAQQIGLALLLALIVFTLFNDFSRLFDFSW
jgi:regulator of sigma E protease